MKKWHVFLLTVLITGTFSGCADLLDNLTESSSSSVVSSSSSSVVADGLPSDLDQTVQITNADSTVVLAKREILERGDLDAAQDSYESGLADYPTDPELNLGYAITVFLKVIGDTNLKAFMADMGFSGMPTNFADLKQSLQSGTFNLLYNGSSVQGTNFDFDFEDLCKKNISDYQDLFDVVLLQRMYKAIRALNIVEQDPSFSVRLNMERLMTNLGMPAGGFKTYEIDLTEVYAYDAVLSFLAAAGNYLLTQNLDLDVRKMVNFSTNLVNSEKALAVYYNPFNDSAYPDFGSLRSDGVQRYANVKYLLLRAGKSFDRGYTYLQAETDDQSDDVIPKVSSDVDLTQLAGFADKMKRSLQGEYVDFIYTNQNQVYNIGMGGVSFGQFLDNAPSVRDLGFELDANGEPVLYDENTNRVVQGEDSKNYFFKMKDPTYGGLLKSDSRVYAAYTNIPMPEYVPAVVYFNSDYPVWMNFLRLAPYAYPTDDWDPADDTTNGATVLAVSTNLVWSDEHFVSPDDDVDWYKVELEAGKAYIFREEATTENDNYFGAEVNLYLGDSVVKWYMQDHEIYIPTNSGIYYIEIYSWGLVQPYKIAFLEAVTTPTNVTSPNYPSNYDVDTDVTYTITQPGASRLGVHFSAFSTESFDYVYIEDTNGTIIATYSGNLGTNFSSSFVNGDTLNVHFVSDGYVTHSGFQIDAIEYEM